MLFQVYDAAFSPPEQNTIVVVGEQFIKFAQLGGRALKFRNGILRSGRKRQKFTCAAYVGSNAVVGCASGELYRFQGRWCIQSIQAHSVCEPVLSLHWSGNGCLISTAGHVPRVFLWRWQFTDNCGIAASSCGCNLGDRGPRRTCENLGQ